LKNGKVTYDAANSMPRRRTSGTFKEKLDQANDYGVNITKSKNSVQEYNLQGPPICSLPSPSLAKISQQKRLKSNNHSSALDVTTPILSPSLKGLKCPHIPRIAMHNNISLQPKSEEEVKLQNEQKVHGYSHGGSSEVAKNGFAHHPCDCDPTCDQNLFALMMAMETDKVKYPLKHGYGVSAVDDEVERVSSSKGDQRICLSEDGTMLRSLQSVRNNIVDDEYSKHGHTDYNSLAGEEKRASEDEEKDHLEENNFLCNKEGQEYDEDNEEEEEEDEEVEEEEEEENGGEEKEEEDMEGKEKMYISDEGDHALFRKREEKEEKHQEMGTPHTFFDAHMTSVKDDDVNATKDDDIVSPHEEDDGVEEEDDDKRRDSEESEEDDDEETENNEEEEKFYNERKDYEEEEDKDEENKNNLHFLGEGKHNLQRREKKYGESGSSLVLSDDETISVEKNYVNAIEEDDDIVSLSPNLDNLNTYIYRHKNEMISLKDAAAAGELKSQTTCVDDDDNYEDGDNVKGKNKYNTGSTVVKTDNTRTAEEVMGAALVQDDEKEGLLAGKAAEVSLIYKDERVGAVTKKICMEEDCNAKVTIMTQPETEREHNVVSKQQHWASPSWWTNWESSKEDGENKGENEVVITDKLQCQPYQPTRYALMEKIKGSDDIPLNHGLEKFCVDELVKEKKQEEIVEEVRLMSYVQFFFPKTFVFSFNTFKTKV